MDFREKIAEMLHPLTGLSVAEASALIELPPEEKLGDYAFPCFTLSKTLKKAPVAIAKELSEKLQQHLKENHLESCSPAGPYINFFVDKKAIAKTTLEKIWREKHGYGKGHEKKERIMIEFSSPNTNKPQHLGHARNNILGETLSNILAWNGFEVVKTCLINDRGIHICKSMLAYKKWGNGKTPESERKKPDHFVGDYYVLFAKESAKDPKLEEEAQDMLRKWEAKDPETVELWETMNKWVYEGFDETYSRMGISFDKTYYESDLYMHGKELVIEGLKKGIFIEEEGAIVVDLEKVKLPKKVLIRSDGTSIYMTQDMYLAKLKFDEYKMDRSIYIVGNEQNLHFQQLFAILKMMKLPFADKCHHLSYGMVYLPEGKMKSREGTVVDVDNLLDELEKGALAEISKRFPDLKKEDAETRAKVIALSAVKFFILKYDHQSDFVFNPKESLSFEGETGPYIQYAYARICSIQEKAGQLPENPSHETELVHEKEQRLIKLMKSYPEVLELAASQYRPALLARHVFSVAQAFNEFYHACPVLQAGKDAEKQARLFLIACTKLVLENGMLLMGMQPIEKM